MRLRLFLRGLSQSIDQDLIKMVSAMKCLICVGTAHRPFCLGPWEERDCPECGHYRVSDQLLLSLMENGQIFDVSKTRGWLASRRRLDWVPFIEVCDGLLVS